MALIVPHAVVAYGRLSRRDAATPRLRALDEGRLVVHEQAIAK
jgi:hypothetical protein